MWKHVELLAAAKCEGFLDTRIDRLYWAMCQYDGVLVAAPVPESQARQDLNAALDAVTRAEIRVDMMAPAPPDSIYEKMLELKANREAELAQSKAHPATGREPIDDTEPEQGA